MIARFMVALTTQLFTHVTLCKYHQEYNAGERGRTNLMSHTRISLSRLKTQQVEATFRTKLPLLNLTEDLLHNNQMPLLSFGHLWKNQEHSDVDVVLTVLQHSQDADQQQQSTQLARFPGHIVLLSSSPMVSAQVSLLRIFGYFGLVLLRSATVMMHRQQSPVFLSQSQQSPAWREMCT